LEPLNHPEERKRYDQNFEDIGKLKNNLKEKGIKYIFSIYKGDVKYNYEGL